MGKTIAIATPVFFALIALEYLVGRARGRHNYRINDAVNSLSLGVMSQVIGLFTKLLAVGIYAAVHSVVAIWQLPSDQWWVWALAIVAYDFCYYWNHRLGHESAVFWAAHVVHHQSQEYNLSTALRQTSSGALLGWVFYLPMAVIGFPPRCSRSRPSSTCSTSTGSTPSRSDRSAGSTAGSARPPTTACTTR